MKYGMKLSNYDIAMIGNLSALTEDKMKGILVDKGDIDPIKRVPLVGFLLEDFDDSFEMPNGKSMKRANRRKATFHKKEERKDLAQKLGYSVGTEYNNKKVRDLLSSNHSDNAYFKGYKAEKKHITIKEETTLMEQEAVEEARETMLGEHKAAMSGFTDTIAYMNSELESYDSTIEAWENDYKELEKLLELLSEKLNDAKLKRNGIKKAISQKVIEKDILEEVQRRERISRFGW